MSQPGWLSSSRAMKAQIRVTANAVWCMLAQLSCSRASARLGIHSDALRSAAPLPVVAAAMPPFAFKDLTLQQVICL